MHWTNSTSDILIAAAYMCVSIIAFTGLLLIFLANRGRRIDNHPVCRRCRYDLHGTPRPFHACPECGLSLHKKSAVRHGNRLKNPLLFALGLALLLPATTYLALDLYTDYTGKPLSQFTPSDMLHYQLEHTDSDPETHFLVLDELIKRAANRELSPSNHLGLINELMSHSRKELLTREPSFSSIFQSAYKQNLLNKEHFTQLSYLLSPELVLDVAPRIYEGSNLPIILTAQGPLVGLDTSNSPLQLRYTISYAFDENPPFARYHKQRIATQSLNLSEQLHVAVKHLKENNLKPDQSHTFKVLIESEIVDARTYQRLYQWGQTIQQPFYLKARRVEHDFNRDQYLMLRRALAAPFRASTTLFSVKVHEDMIYTYFNCDQVDLPMYHRLVAQIDQNPSKDVAYIQGKGPWEMSVGIAYPEGQTPRTITLHLIPMLDEAERQPDIHHIFASPIEVQAALPQPNQ